jgi:malonate-semialdehyde dehydrogenase (acetylating) / methylmalonate-semialdehyde dehydrogenase
MNTALNLIEGSWRAVDADFVDDVFNPATGEVIAKLPYSRPRDVDEAIAASAAALHDWARLPINERLKPLVRLRSLVEGQAKELALLIVTENGKTFAEAQDEVQQAIKVIDFACQAPAILSWASMNPVGADELSFRLPAGICAGVSYYNFPLVTVLWMVAPALACGNTFVLRPCTYSPLSGTRVAALLNEAELPPGVLNVVHGAIEVVDQILGDERVAALSYVGSGPWAHYMYRLGATAGKRIQSLGAVRSVVVVMEDADVSAAVEAIRASAFAMTGQRWLGGTIVVTVGSIGEPLVAALVESARGISVGPGSEAGVSMGPIIRADRRHDAVSLIDRAASDGAILSLDGRAKTSGDGYFIGPTVIDLVENDHNLLSQEFFGPICAVTHATDLRDAIRIVNRHVRGGVASIFTASEDSAKLFSQEAGAALVDINPGREPCEFLPEAISPSYHGDLSMSGGDDIFRFYTRRQAIRSPRL